MKKTINILGERYKLRFKNYSEDPLFAQRCIDGYHDSINKQIVVCNMKTYPSWENETAAYCKKVEKQILRHEIIHAVFFEAGLVKYFEDEELTDTIAYLAPKMVEIMKAIDLT